MKIDDLPIRYQQQAREALAGRKIPSKAAHLEPHTGNQPLAAQKAQGFDGQVDIHFREKRHRLADPDGACTKYCTDGLVSAGILRDDSTKEIGQVSKEQIKIGKDDQEETVIEIRRR